MKAGGPVRLIRPARRWICLDSGCDATSFTEQVPAIEGWASSTRHCTETGDLSPIPARGIDARGTGHLAPDGISRHLAKDRTMLAPSSRQVTPVPRTPHQGPVAEPAPSCSRNPASTGHQDGSGDADGIVRAPAGEIGPIRSGESSQSRPMGATERGGPGGASIRRRVRRRAGRPSGADRASRCTSSGCHAGVGGGPGWLGHAPGRPDPALRRRTMRSCGGWRRRPPGRR